MNAYITLLRGINVSGQKIIKMEDLRRYYTEAGYLDVKTYIQSGNVFFRSPETDPALLLAAVESMQATALGYHVPTVLRTPGQLRTALESTPFPAPMGKHEQVYIGFMMQEPNPVDIAALEACSDELDTYKVIGREVYIHSWKDKPGKSKMTPGLLEKKLKRPLTTRNWATTFTLAGWG
jgi:uncharacterized protein (DUF1697 family)